MPKTKKVKYKYTTLVIQNKIVSGENKKFEYAEEYEIPNALTDNKLITHIAKALFYQEAYPTSNTWSESKDKRYYKAMALCTLFAIGNYKVE